MNSWRKVKKETIVNCFCKCGFNEATLEIFVDDNADTDFAGMQNYMQEISSDSTVNTYLHQDKYEVTSVNTVDIRSINWKEDLREKPILCVIEDDDETN